MTNEQKTMAARSAKILIPLCAAGALIAGCGGGGGGMTATLPHQNTPAGTSPSKGGGAQTTALLTITIPARGAQPLKAKRHAKYISPASTTLGVTIATAAQPSPTPTYFTLPTPGPSPISTTLPVGAPVGTDTVTANVYDAQPGPSASPNLLSTGSTTATIGTGSSPVAVQTLGVAAGVMLAGPSPNPSSVEFFQNHGVAQSVALTATPIDADGYAITGTLARPVPLQTPSDVSVSPASLTTGGATALTATYPALQAGTGGVVSGGLPLDTASGSTDNYAIQATQYLFVVTIMTSNSTSNTLYVVDPLTQSLVGTFALPSMYILNPALVGVAGCTTGETAVISAPQGFSVEVTLPTPGSSVSSVAAVDLTSTIAPLSQHSAANATTYLAADTTCGVYSAADATLTRYSGFGSANGVTATAVNTAGDSNVTWAPNDSIAVAGSTIYATNVANDNVGTGGVTVQSVPVSGGSVTNVGTIAGNAQGRDEGLSVSGTSVYELNGNLAGSTITDALTTIPGLTSTTIGTVPRFYGPYEYGVAPNGTIYFFAPSAKFTNTAQSTPIVAVNGIAGAVMSDGRYLAVVSAGSPPSVQIESPSATAGGNPTAVGAPIPLTRAPSGSNYYQYPFVAAFPH